jgi:membrane glycosyltransferase
LLRALGVEPSPHGSWGRTKIIPSDGNLMLLVKPMRATLGWKGALKTVQRSQDSFHIHPLTRRIVRQQSLGLVVVVVVVVVHHLLLLLK